MFPKHPATEAALTVLLAVKDQFRLEEERASRAPSRMRIAPLGPATSAEARGEASFLRIVSITEAYVDVVQMTLLLREFPNPSSVMLKLLDSIETEATSNWMKRKEAFSKYHGLDLATCPRWNELQIATRVRNCLAHALGGVTPRYRTRSRFAIDLSKISVGVGGGRVHVTSASVKVVEEIASDFIRGVDQRT